MTSMKCFRGEIDAMPYMGTCILKAAGDKNNSGRSFDERWRVVAAVQIYRDVTDSQEEEINNLTKYGKSKKSLISFDFFSVLHIISNICNAWHFVSYKLTRIQAKSTNLCFLSGKNNNNAHTNSISICTNYQNVRISNNFQYH